MGQGELRTLHKTHFMLLFFAAVPRKTGPFTNKEISLLPLFHKSEYSATGICCSSFDNAHRLISAFIRPESTLRAQLQACYPSISFPSIMLAELVHLYARGDFLLGIVKEYVDPDDMESYQIKNENYYFIFDLQPLNFDILHRKL